MADDPTVRPFSSGSQYADWTDSNCGTCTKAAPLDTPVPIEVGCEIEKALMVAYVGDGTIPLPIADRMGRDQGRYNWPCREHQPPFVNVRPDGTVDPDIKKEDC